MDNLYYEEMIEKLDALCKKNKLTGKKIFLFGHCEATERLVDELFCRDLLVESILDNNTHKQGDEYRGIPIHLPEHIMVNSGRDSVVCIVARAFSAMEAQLHSMGYEGNIYRLATYDSFSNYSLDCDTILHMYQREQRGEDRLSELKENFPDGFFFLCPFAALGDIYYTMAFMPHFLKIRGIEKERVVIAVLGESLRQVVKIFGMDQVCVFQQFEMDEMIQAALYTEDEDVFIPHQDRPYTVNISRVLYRKKIPLVDLYRYGVYGLDSSCKPCAPSSDRYDNYPQLSRICKGKAVILSPYAKSVPMLSMDMWNPIIEYFRENHYQVFSNVVDKEIPLPGTIGISPALFEMKSVVEWGGIFIGIRSGLCDILQEAKCLKIALYPEYFYTDTRWTAIEMYALSGWKNILVTENFTIDVLRGVLNNE